jgi:hypothetical protein
LLDPKSKEVVWKDTFKKIDIRRWLPGDKWNKDEQLYEVKPKIYQVHGSFMLSTAVLEGQYVLALAILDPAGMLPSVRFAIRNYLIGGRHPIGLVGVNRTVENTDLDSDCFADPAKDRTLHYELYP